MTFKTNLAAGCCPALSGFSVLAVEGHDAGAFLQAQLMNDVAALEPGRWQWNGWLTPKGRVIALFALVQLAPGRYWLVLPDMPAGELLPRLQRFVFRSRLALVADAGVVAASGPVATTPAPDRFAGEPGQAVALDLGGAGGARTLWLLPAGDPALAAPEPAVDAAWFGFDLAHGLPRLPATPAEAWTPQMLSLERLGAFSLKKGCYPGQEIVARTHYLGQAKRGLVRLAGHGLQSGHAVEADGQAVGSLACAGADGREALAVLSLDAGQALSIDGRPLQRLELREGLARPS